MKKILLAVVAIGLGTSAIGVQIQNDKSATHKTVLNDGPEPDCLPDCDVK